MPSYDRLLMVACKDSRSIRAVLSGNERAIEVSSLGGDEWLEIELGTNSTQVRSRVSSNGEHPIEKGFSWINLTKSGQGSPTTVKLLHDV